MAGSGGDEDLRRHEIYEDEYIEQGRGSRSKMTYRYEDSSTTSTGSWYNLTIMRNSREKWSWNWYEQNKVFFKSSIFPKN